jgi:ubiquinone biosynthesis protein
MIQPPIIPTNGSRPKTASVRPLVVKGKTPRRIHKSVADGWARQNRAAKPGKVHIHIGGRHGDIIHRAMMRVPTELLPSPADDDLPVVRSLPRRKFAKTVVSDDYVQMQMSIPTPPKVGLFQTLRRLGVWVSAFVGYQRGTLIDKLRGRDSEDRRAVRLRETFERVGGTFVKIGQQMSSRLDLLPVRYCQELANMLDNVPPFPSEQAIAIIERTTGKPLGETFSAFDPQPIGSASIACVYQAVLRSTGAKVVVKVRRPNIRERFEEDFRVIDLLSNIVEGLTLVRPGFTVNLRAEFRNTLSSELDFRREARLCELFQRRSSKLREQYFTAPKMHFECSSEEVLVQEFASGMWLWEILAAVEHREPAAVARMRELNINPTEVARRLIYANNWGIFAHLAFHADPHPANIVVQANNKVVFVDFGACGYINSPRRAIYQRVFESFLNEDAYAMAQCSLAMLEPLPPMDINAITKDTENAYHNQLIAMKSKHSPWFERTTASLLVASINVTGKYNLPVPQDYLMFTRASLLYDTMCARLDPQFDSYKEYKRFRNDIRRKAGKRARRALRERLTKGITGGDYLALGQMLKTGGDLMFRAQRLMSAPYDFAVTSFQIEKWTNTVMMLVQFVTRAAIVTLVGLGIVELLAPQDVMTALQQVVVSPIYLVVIAVLLIQHIRLIMFRLGDKTRKE